MARVTVIYHHYPHYRRPVLRELVKSGRHDFQFWGALAAVDGVEAFQGDDLVAIHPLQFALRGRIWRLRGYWSAVLDRAVDVLIVHGHPNMPASWLIGIVGRLSGKTVLYWAHGWRKQEAPLKAVMRNLHYRLGNLTMTYADRAREIAEATGFPKGRVVPIYNSLDWLTAQAILQRLQAKGRLHVRRSLGIADAAFRIVCVARLTRKCRFDLLLGAMAILQSRGLAVELCLIGDGDEREALAQQAGDLGVQVAFLGAVYDEEILGRQIYASDLTACPGKVGLSAIHSMMYGTPVISHGDLDTQMPEVEAIVEGQTGSLFRLNDPTDLADKIGGWMGPGHDRAATLRHCIAMIETRYNPVTQARLINAAIDQASGGKRRHG